MAHLGVTYGPEPQPYIIHEHSQEARECSPVVHTTHFFGVMIFYFRSFTPHTTLG